jgi:hypothetical protein
MTCANYFFGVQQFPEREKKARVQWLLGGHKLFENETKQLEYWQNKAAWIGKPEFNTSDDKYTFACEMEIYIFGLM